MSDPTRLHRDPATAHTGTGPVTPPGEHPAETRARSFADAPAGTTPGTPPGGVWSAYDDAFFDEPVHDPFLDDPFEDEESYLYYGGAGAYDAQGDDLYGDDRGGLAADIAARGRSAGAGVLSLARENPVGTALAAAGIALLFAPRIEREDARAAMDRA